MKKLFLLFALVFITGFAIAQTTCPTPVTQFTFSFAKPVTVNQVLGGASVCDPDVSVPSASTATWTIVETGTPFKIVDIGSGKVNFVVNDATAINSSASNTYTFTIKVTDKGISSDPTPKSSTAVVTLNNSNSPPVIINQTL